MTGQDGASDHGRLRPTCAGPSLQAPVVVPTWFHHSTYLLVLGLYTSSGLRRGKG